MALANNLKTKPKYKPPGRWKKGESGNPSGRPKDLPELRKLARSHGEHCIQRLFELSQDQNGKVAVAACSILLDRGYGKAIQSVEVSDQRLPPNANQQLITAMNREELKTLKTMAQLVLQRQAQLIQGQPDAQR